MALTARGKRRRRRELLLGLSGLGVTRLEVELVDHPEADAEQDRQRHGNHPVALDRHDNVPDEGASLEVGDGRGARRHLVAHAGGKLGERR